MLQETHTRDTNSDPFHAQVASQHFLTACRTSSILYIRYIRYIENILLPSELCGTIYLSIVHLEKRLRAEPKPGKGNNFHFHLHAATYSRDHWRSLSRSLSIWRGCTFTRCTMVRGRAGCPVTTLGSAIIFNNFLCLNSFSFSWSQQLRCMATNSHKVTIVHNWSVRCKDTIAHSEGVGVGGRLREWDWSCRYKITWLH